MRTSVSLPSAPKNNQVVRRSSSSVTRTQAVKQEAPPSAVAASTKNEAQMLTEKYGFSNVEEGMFGFKPFSELFVGRLAMAGFAVQLVEEILGHGGFLYQVGFQTPDDNLFLALAAFFGVAVTVGTIKPFVDAASGEMTMRDALRYRNFFGLNRENDILSSAEKEMKNTPDAFTPPNTERENAEIDAARAQGTAADSVLAADGNVAQEAAVSLKEPRGDASAPSTSLAAKEDILEQLGTQAGDFEMQWLRSVEMNNGRAAMIGYLAGVLVEAKTGAGPLGQLIDWGVWLNLLGADSGIQSNIQF